LDHISNKLIWSDETFRIFSLNPKEFEPFRETFYKKIHPEDRDKVREAFLNSLETKKNYKMEHRILLKSGEVKYALQKGVTHYDDTGKPIRSIGTIQDITESKKVEQEIIKSKEKAEESDSLKTEFLNNMSHEIRTPMNGILGFSGFLNDPNLDEKKRKNYVKIIQNSGNQLLGIIDDILEISTLETKQVILKEEETNLNDLLFELFSIFDLKAKGTRISLFLDKGLSDEQSIILTDRVKLHKVISNLLENALKFTNRGKINFGYKLNDKKLEFFVRDTGIGIPKTKIKIIFERFSQADKELSKKVGGLGLGLSIAKENVILLGGDISVESEMLKGSTFRFDIPFKPFDSEIGIHENVADEEIENKFTFLIVEDEEVNFMFIEILLLEKLKIKCNIIHAINGKEAVEICENNANIDFVLMDLKMPVMDGIEATKLIKKFRPDLPIIAQSAYTSYQDKKRAEDAGCSDFISKPIKKEILNNSINNFIKTKLQ
jgi:signal transduction histidine kinase/CheY-like chemotaxis protein